MGRKGLLPRLVPLEAMTGREAVREDIWKTCKT